MTPRVSSVQAPIRPSATQPVHPGPALRCAALALCDQNTDSPHAISDPNGVTTSSHLQHATTRARNRPKYGPTPHTCPAPYRPTLKHRRPPPLPVNPLVITLPLGDQLANETLHGSAPRPRPTTRALHQAPPLDRDHRTDGPLHPRPTLPRAPAGLPAKRLLHPTPAIIPMVLVAALRDPIAHPAPSFTGPPATPARHYRWDPRFPPRSDQLRLSAGASVPSTRPGTPTAPQIALAPVPAIPKRMDR